MPFALRPETQLRHAPHALEICDRCTAELLDDEGQGGEAVLPGSRGVKTAEVGRDLFAVPNEAELVTIDVRLEALSGAPR